jgi:hypothetical protein
MEGLIMTIDLDIQKILWQACEEKQERAKKLPTEDDCIEMMIQCRLRLEELGWKPGEYAPRDGREFIGINAGFRGPSVCIKLGDGYFTADSGNWFPHPRPLVFKEK